MAAECNHQYMNQDKFNLQSDQLVTKLSRQKFVFQAKLNLNITSLELRGICVPQIKCKPVKPMNQAEQNLLVVNKKQQAGVIFTEARAPKTNEDAGNEVT